MWRDSVNRVLGSSLSVFGEAVTYRPRNGQPFAVRGIFNTIFSQVDPDTGAVVGSNQPNLGVRLSDFPLKPDGGDKVIISGTLYTVTDAQEDGEGGAKLMLHRISE